MDQIETVVEIQSWRAEPRKLMVEIGFPIFRHVRSRHYWRSPRTPTDPRCGWYHDEMLESSPDQEELADILNRLVLAHPVLKGMAESYGIQRGVQ